MKKPKTTRNERETRERGQLSIFMAFLFPVLFLFFSMMINISLILYDKINLQNSVDLAAYYGAQRQAEILNWVAAENYQLRQNYKLFAHRQRILGTVGHISSPASVHPNSPQPPFSEEPTISKLSAEPVVCADTSVLNFDSSKRRGEANHSQCRAPDSLRRYFPPPAPLIAIFNPINLYANLFVERRREDFYKDCKSTSALNWETASLFHLIFHQEARYRSARINRIALNLSRSTEDFSDLEGQSVLLGARKTFLKNLTRGSGETSLAMYNSLGGVPVRSWLSPIQSFHHSQYLNLISNTCSGSSRSIFEGNFQASHSALSQLLKDYLINENTTVGFEKNPWYMSYVGVRGVRYSRKSFALFGRPVRLEAQSFAKPFGGRIGPWYGKSWSATANQSSKLPSDRVDPLMSPRDERPKSKEEDLAFFPNYSRFPGDSLGLQSMASLGAFKSLFSGYSPDDGRVIRQGLIRNLQNYIAAETNPQVIPYPNYRSANSQEVVTVFDRMAFVPNLFDIYYYSIEPRYTNFYAASYLPSYPIGSYSDSSNQVSLQEIDSVIALSAQIFNPSQRRQFYWWTSLNERSVFSQGLTGWASRRVSKYDEFPDRFFTKCYREIRDQEPASPGGCISGGRTGYSVKMVSSNYLNSSLSMGGNTGKIRNPPEGNF